MAKNIRMVNHFNPMTLIMGIIWTVFCGLITVQVIFAGLHEVGFSFIPIIFLSIFDVIGLALIISNIISLIRCSILKTSGTKIRGTFQNITSSNNGVLFITVSFVNEEGENIIAKGTLLGTYANLYSPGDSFPLVVKGRLVMVDMDEIKQQEPRSYFGSNFQNPTSSSTFDSDTFGDRIKYCPNCGVQLRFGDRYCAHCGAKIEEDEK